MVPIPLPSPPSWIISPLLRLRSEPSTTSTQPQPQSNHNNPTPDSIQLTPRGEIFSIPATYGRLDSSPSPGTVAGIILGSVVGFIFLLYLLYLAISSGRNRGTVVAESESVEVRSSRRRRGGGSRGSSGRSHGNSDVVEVFEENDSFPRGPRSSRGSRSRRHHDNVVVDEESVVTDRTRSDENEVIVEEEHSSIVSPSPSARRYRRPRGSYRAVDRDDFGSSIDGSHDRY